MGHTISKNNPGCAPWQLIIHLVGGGSIWYGNDIFHISSSTNCNVNLLTVTRKEKAKHKINRDFERGTEQSQVRGEILKTTLVPLSGLSA